MSPDASTETSETNSVRPVPGRYSGIRHGLTILGIGVVLIGGALALLQGPVRGWNGRSRCRRCWSGMASSGGATAHRIAPGAAAWPRALRPAHPHRITASSPARPARCATAET
jgi:hypothetical protein